MSEPLVMDADVRRELQTDLLAAVGKIMRHEDSGESRDRVIFSDAELYAIKCALVVALL